MIVGAYCRALSNKEHSRTWSVRIYVPLRLMGHSLARPCPRPKKAWVMVTQCGFFISSEARNFMRQVSRKHSFQMHKMPRAAKDGKSLAIGNPSPHACRRPIARCFLLIFPLPTSCFASSFRGSDGKCSDKSPTPRLCASSLGDDASWARVSFARCLGSSEILFSSDTWRRLFVVIHGVYHAFISHCSLRTGHYPMNVSHGPFPTRVGLPPTYAVDVVDEHIGVSCQV
uniref:Uncharacterized protein n=1 Tax=Candidatus Kentrum sp. SD TaxID=2126332 RepID=A0A450YEX4_9GAMM|nr:MAG: hypothetical protein BECKSD772F_GA0070984_10519 [Candidatus Kentron sp. SD]VFK45150.1 MAG: hypothetical protein BECKSD772E_GA0070983_104911 [Candidatus Kentron sp. SD]